MNGDRSYTGAAVVTNTFLTGTIRKQYDNQVPLWTGEQTSLCLGKITECLVLDKRGCCCHEVDNVNRTCNVSQTNRRVQAALWMSLTNRHTYYRVRWSTKFTCPVTGYCVMRVHMPVSDPLLQIYSFFNFFSAHKLIPLVHPNFKGNQAFHPYLVHISIHLISCACHFSPQPLEVAQHF